MQGGKASNFGSLKAHHQQLVRLGMLAESYFADDPAVVARLLQRELGDAMAELRALLGELGEDPDAVLDDLPLNELRAVETQA